MQGTHDNTVTLMASGAIPRNARVAIPSSNAGAPAQCDAAGANEAAIGVALYAAADGEPVAVRMYGAGTMHMIASKAIDQGEPVYGAADGEITDVSTSAAIIGVALEAAAADQDIILVAPYGREITV